MQSVEGAVMTTNVLICGVGGQGVILASDILAQVALKEGCDVKKSEVHGMAQRGGSVVSHVRFGDKVYSPLIPEGAVQFILAFELLEGFRYLSFLVPKGTILCDPLRLAPAGVLTGAEDYPSDLKERIRRRTANAYFIEGQSLAQSLGNPRVQNTIFLGALAHFLKFSEESWQGGLRELIKPRYQELNLIAFKKGEKLIKSLI
jgi:indolepyruvate ferredoxin oxidoreductase beta subunit